MADALPLCRPAEGARLVLSGQLFVAGPSTSHAQPQRLCRRLAGGWRAEDAKSTAGRWAAPMPNVHARISRA
eukprot:356656-Chlamydomonas_euryale.AAC.2